MTTTTIKEVSKKMVDSDTNDEIQLVVFELGDEEFGVEISQVREIIKPVDITKMPNTPDHVNGVINLRGSITTVMDLRKKLGIHHSQETNQKMRIVIIELEDNTIGMMVDSVSEVLRLPLSDIDSKVNETSEIDAEYIRGIGKLENRMLILLDLNKVISAKEMSTIGKAKEKVAVEA